ncbi:hypothetical protein CDLVIII_0883 [Clostridium sp. DL-VIII]|uniref:flavodoxin n=1 Tax=Clostridium sp. DL-VIII TaxID=641107 RepID=UPI00023AF199|nr:flavodoxin [Clostridium sp. DL-VIII]EHI97604.1 hypothetical protein CDLVIII_0883 [Clostridium sp. DL-VIII]
MVAILALIIITVFGYWYLMLGKTIDNVTNEVVKGNEGTKSLVVYFTRAGVIETDTDIDAITSASLNRNRGNTEIAAKMIQKETGADMYQIYTDRYYRTSFMGTAATAWIEKTLNLRPKLANKLDSLDDYDVIYVGYPIWWFNAPMAIGTFLESYDLRGKTIVPFCTSQDNNIDISMEYINNICKDATVLKGLTVNQVKEEKIKQWLNEIGLLENK